MNHEAIADAAARVERGAKLWIASAAVGGTPHIAAGGALQMLDEDHLEVRAWFCPETVRNLSDNRRLSLVVWEETQPESGYQILGEVESIDEGARVDAYVPGGEEGRRQMSQDQEPQEQQRLRLRIERVTGFHDGPHTDTAI